ncbi:MAG: sigma-70 family RNA polymerase sigma factor [Syntrophobacteraceae bacterium]
MSQAKYLSNKPMTPDSIQDRNRIVTEHAVLVKIAALRLASRLPRSIDADDLFSAGAIGLMDAIEKFDPTHGVPFEAYARLRIHGAIVDQVREMYWVPRSLRNKSRAIENACAEIDRKTGQIPDDEAVAAEMGISLDELGRAL